jgi:hypothetical protein
MEPTMRSTAVRLGVLLLATFASGCSETVVDASTTVPGHECLGLARRAAEAMPVDPHVKTRARLQADVVAACLRLDHLEFVDAAIADIRNWRRGVAAADAAVHFATRGDTARAKRMLDLARSTSAAADPNDQEWRAERVAAAVARAESFLSRAETATADESDASFDAQLAAIDAAIATGAFDAAKGALDACVDLFARHRDDPKRRAALHDRITEGFPKLPVPARVDVLSRTAEVALDAGDRDGARTYVANARERLRATRVVTEQDLTMRARLAALTHRCGDAERAKRDLDECLTEFEAATPRILDIDRAGVLRSIAEALHVCADRERSRAVYLRAIEAGVVNPNSRPRAVDVVATCISLAEHRVAVDAELRAALQRVVEGLGDPW